MRYISRAITRAFSGSGVLYAVPVPGSTLHVWHSSSVGATKFMPETSSDIHKSVMLTESVDQLGVSPAGKIWVDATAGMGGHLREIVRRCNGSGTVFGIDQDKTALALCRQSIEREFPRVPIRSGPDASAKEGSSENISVSLLHGNFSDIATLMADCGVERIDGGILADIGVSSLQLDSPERGFSFMSDGPLDMRMDTSRGRTAADIVNNISEKELADIIYIYGEERLSRRIAAKIVQSRPLTTTAELREVVASVVPRMHASKNRPADKSHPATRTFQALRIAVNDELGVLESFLRSTIKILAPGARIVVISFHSLEDRVVKQIFKEFASPCICPPRYPICTCAKQQELKILTPKPLQPSETEILANPRSRSAKLRAGERVVKEP